MKLTVAGVRSVEIEMADPRSAVTFFRDIWSLTEVDSRGGSTWFRATGKYHHVLAIHQAETAAGMHRIVFDAANKSVVDALQEKVAAAGCKSETPHEIKSAGGGYGFGFTDVEGRNLGIICDARDHGDSGDIRDRPRKIAHVNINAAQLERTNTFLVDVLGFRLVDHSGLLHFFHCDNPDHSSIVTGQTRTPTLNHVSFEMPDLDSCMRGGGRMRDAGYPIEWGPGRHGAGNNVFCYFAGPEEFPIEYTAEVMQIDDNYQFHGPEYWKWPPGRLDQWGITPPHTPRWKRIQDLFLFRPGQYQIT
ncbi:MAG: VOC family protein [Xanthobacteraceae bacterium]